MEHNTLFFDKFKGIRTVNPLADPFSGIMSAISSKNVELKFSNNGDNVGIYTMLGNRAIATLSDEQQIIRGQWESVQNGIRYWIVYATDDTRGYLYNYLYSSQSFELIYDGLSPSSECNAITVAQGFTDYLFFTNGIDAPVAVNIMSTPQYQTVNAVDAEGRDIRGLGLESYDGRLVMLSGNRVHWSKQLDIFDWSANDTGNLTNAAYQEFDRNTTACIFYDNRLIVWTLDNSVAFTGNPADTVSFLRSGASGGGCTSFGSVLRFDNKVFYYDHKARNIFAYYLYDVGQTRPTDGFGDNVRRYFNQIDETKFNRIYLLPFISEQKNEIWLKLPTVSGSIILVLDYTKGEWLVRDEQSIVSFLTFNNAVYSSFENKILREYLDSTFNGEFRGAEYLFNIVNCGSDSNLKIPKYPIILTLDSAYHNDFYIDFTYNDNPETTKTKHISRGYPSNVLIWVDNDDDLSGGWWSDDDADTTGGVWIDNNSYNVLLRVPNLLPFKQLQMRIYTLESPQDFGIKRIEMKRVKIKTKTMT